MRDRNQDGVQDYPHHDVQVAEDEHSGCYGAVQHAVQDRGEGIFGPLAYQPIYFVSEPSLTPSQNGEPYILSLEAGPAHEDARSQGYSFVAKSEFKTIEDMRFYDNECVAHQVLKFGTKPLGVEGVMTIYYEVSWSLLCGDGTEGRSKLKSGMG